MGKFSRRHRGAPMMDAEYEERCGKLSTLIFTDHDNIALLKLHPDFKAMLYTAMSRMEASLYLDDAFPDRLGRQKRPMLMQCLLDACREHELEILAERLCTDGTWARKIVKMVSHRDYLCWPVSHVCYS